MEEKEKSPQEKRAEMKWVIVYNKNNHNPWSFHYCDYDERLKLLDKVSIGNIDILFISKTLDRFCLMTIDKYCIAHKLEPPTRNM